MISDTCPSCHASLIGEEVQGSPGAYYQRPIAIIDRDRDRIIAWECPDCHHRWPRGPA
jgi:hypothetical protein